MEFLIIVGLVFVLLVAFGAIAARGDRAKKEKEPSPHAEVKAAVQEQKKEPSSHAEAKAAVQEKKKEPSSHAEAKAAVQEKKKEPSSHAEAKAAAPTKKSTEPEAKTESYKNKPVIHLELPYEKPVDFELSYTTDQLSCTRAEVEHGVSKKKNERYSYTKVSTPTTQCRSHASSNFYFDVVGICYRGLRSIEIASRLHPNDRLILVREPSNVYDKYAVRVYTQSGEWIGYVPKIYSIVVSKDFDFIKDCKVSYLTYSPLKIYAIIEFSDTPCRQQDFIPMPLDALMDEYLQLHDTHSFNFISKFYVVNTYDLGRECVTAARGMQYGDKVVFVPSPDSYSPYRIEVYNIHGERLGNISKHLDKEISALLERIVFARVVEPITSLNDTLGLETLCKGEFYHDNENYNPPYGDCLYPEMYEAMEIKKHDVEAALEILLPLAEKERWVDIKFKCCQCFRKLKRYREEKAMLEKIINIIDEATEADLPTSRLKDLKESKVLYQERLSTVEKRIK